MSEVNSLILQRQCSLNHDVMLLWPDSSASLSAALHSPSHICSLHTIAKKTDFYKQGCRKGGRKGAHAQGPGNMEGARVHDENVSPVITTQKTGNQVMCTGAWELQGGRVLRIS